MVGWIEFACTAPAGQRMTMKTGEILQDGCFYQDNLRKAKSAFQYVSDGVERRVHPHFTFYGFRYVLLEGWVGEVKAEDFEGCVIHSDMEELGKIHTSDPLVNQLVKNVRWGQKGNFLDVPTDCPQRDERMGWTGDAQVFAGTASFNMDTYAFYTKFGHDVYYEQQKLGGSVPFVVPTVNYKGDGSTVWGETATVIPWQVYLHYGDMTILKRQYESMKAWVEYMVQRDEESGEPGLWDSGYHFADWLALDGPVEGGVYGGTDPYFIASVNYYYSTVIVAKTAAILGFTEDSERYEQLADKIKRVINKEYITPSGRLAVGTQTAHVLALFMDVVPEEMRERIAKDLYVKIKNNNYHLQTGFSGTPYLCRVLSDNGYNDAVYRLLMTKEYPGWLYEVLMGATTVWERWNSVMPDGKISSTGMNSLNHYAYGSVVEWLYRNAAGIQPSERGPGYRYFVIHPQPSYQIRKMNCELNSASGYIRSSWEILDPGHLKVGIHIPFMSTAQIVLPDAEAEELIEATGFEWVQDGSNAVCELKSGTYEFMYTLRKEYKKLYLVQSPVSELMENEDAKKIILNNIPDFKKIPFLMKSPFWMIC